MAAGVSIASEYGKLQDLWRNIERDEEWKIGRASCRERGENGGGAGATE